MNTTSMETRSEYKVNCQSKVQPVSLSQPIPPAPLSPGNQFPQVTQQASESIQSTVAQNVILGLAWLSSPT